jgi:hypothetical protein
MIGDLDELKGKLRVIRDGFFPYDGCRVQKVVAYESGSGTVWLVVSGSEMISGRIPFGSRKKL